MGLPFVFPSVSADYFLCLPYNEPMILETFPIGPLQCNCIILGDEEAGEAIVVDPGGDVPHIHRRLTEQNLKLKQILLTHAHIDHVGGAFQLKQLTGAPIFLNENDLPMMKMLAVQAGWFGLETPETPHPDQFLTDGQIVGLDRYPAEVLCTPGHSQGSVCFHIPSLNLLIAGDTLFAGGIGRTDLPGGSYEQIIHSIQTRLAPLPPETKVMPGHGPSTTIGEELQNNTFAGMR